MTALQIATALVFLNLVTAFTSSPPLPLKHAATTATSFRYYARSRLNMATMNFNGESSSNLIVSLPAGASPSRSLPEWLKRSDSDAHLLGAKEFEPRSDGLWDCIQPTIGWFGLKLSPVFTNQLDRSHQRAVVTIVDARTDIISGRIAGSVISTVMEKATFVGRNAVSCKDHDEGVWTLSSDFSLTLQVPFPPLVLLPPGFNTIGSRIVSSTCEKRVTENLEGLREAYLAWASIPGDP